MPTVPSNQSDKAPKPIISININTEKSKFSPEPNTNKIKANTLSMAVSKTETNPTFKNTKQSRISRNNELNEVDKLILKKILNSHFLFKDKSQEILSKIVLSIETKKYETGTELTTQDLFYIVKDGKVEVSTESNNPLYLRGNFRRIVPNRKEKKQYKNSNFRKRDLIHIERRNFSKYSSKNQRKRT